MALANRFLSVVDYDPTTNQYTEIGVPEYLKKLEVLGIPEDVKENLLEEKLQYKKDELFRIGFKEEEVEEIIERLKQKDMEAYLNESIPEEPPIEE